MSYNYHSYASFGNLKFHADLDWTAICAFLNRHHHDDLRRTARFEEVFEEKLTELKWDRMRRAKRKPVATAVAEQGLQQRSGTNPEAAG